MNISAISNMHLKYYIKINYIDLKKCDFITNSLLFLGYIVSVGGTDIDEENMKDINDWLAPTSIH